MTATAIIEQVAADGVRLWPNGDRLAYEGPSGAVARWKPILAASKPEILAALSLACTPETPQIDNGGCDARKATATASRWWLLHYSDREPVEVASFPDATHAEILERHKGAIAAEPFNQTEPVAAGLSALPGVIRNSPDQGAACPAWLATLSGDLEARILAMAARWDYSGTDLALALAGARADPAGWWRVVEPAQEHAQRCAHPDLPIDLGKR